MAWQKRYPKSVSLCLHCSQSLVPDMSLEDKNAYCLSSLKIICKYGLNTTTSYWCSRQNKADKLPFYAWLQTCERNIFESNLVMSIPNFFSKNVAKISLELGPAPPALQSCDPLSLLSRDTKKGINTKTSLSGHPSVTYYYKASIMCMETILRCGGCGAEVSYVMNYCGRNDCSGCDTVVDYSGDCGECRTPTRDGKK